MEYQALAEQLVKKCLKKGADAAEVYLESGRNFSLELRDGEIETVQEASTQGVGFRVFVKGRMAFSSCNDLDGAALDNAISRACEFAGKTTPDENNVLPDDRQMQEVPGLYDPRIAEVPLAEKIALAREVEKQALADKRITRSAGASFAEGENLVVIANSNMLSKSFRSTFCGFGVSVVAEKGDQKSSGYDACYRRFFADLKLPSQVAAKAARIAADMLDPRPLKTQKAAVIFDPDAAYALLGGILAAIDGESVLQGASFLAKKLGQKIASPLVTLVDDGILPKGLASAPFDGEGVSTRRRTILDAGVLKGFLYNTAVAKRAGVKSTGSASRGGFTALPAIGPTNFFMAAGTATSEEIVRETRTGLLVKEVTGYGINPVNGQFSGGASGFWIEEGRIAFPVKGVTIAGSAGDMLNGIDAVGNDLDLNQTLTAPTFRIKLLQIGGE